MSKWVEGNIEMNCSISTLKKAICNIMPEWEKHIISSESPRPMYRYDGTPVEESQGVAQYANVIIPGGSRGPSSRSIDNDWGFIQLESGKWKTVYADYNLNSAKEMEGKIKAEIAKIKTIELAHLNQYEITFMESNEEEEIIHLKIDLEKFNIGLLN